MILGHDVAARDLLSAFRGGRLHHAWLLAGPRGIGKASFAVAAARRILAEAVGPIPDMPGLDVPADHATTRLMAAGSHPDFRLLERLEKPTGGLARNISVDQVRSLGRTLSVTSSLSPWRVIVIDSADDLEGSGANALLKMLEEPPPNTLFLLVSHAPGRLLPTIRSRCRRIDLAPLDNAAMTSWASRWFSSHGDQERALLIDLAGGRPGRALEIDQLDLAALEAEAMALMSEGDPDNARRARLASGLSGKAAAERYAAFVALVPSLIAREARRLPEPRRSRALDAYARARDTAVLAPRLSLDPGATVFELGGILASVALKP